MMGSGTAISTATLGSINPAAESVRTTLTTAYISLTSGKREISSYHRRRHHHRFARRRIVRSRCNDGKEGAETSSSSRVAAAEEEDWVRSPSASPYEILGIDRTSSCSPSQLKAAFRARVKKFHPDIMTNNSGDDALIRRVIRAYEILSTKHDHQQHQQQEEVKTSLDLDPFDEPECEAYDLFINGTLCVGKGCPYSCVKRAPHAFSFASINGTARAMSLEGRGGEEEDDDDYLVQLAVGQCPRRCIYYVTPSQRAVLEDLLDCILDAPYDSAADAALLESLLSKAQFENSRFQRPKRTIEYSTEYVDWC